MKHVVLFHWAVRHMVSGSAIGLSCGTYVPHHDTVMYYTKTVLLDQGYAQSAHQGEGTTFTSNVVSDAGGHVHKVKCGMLVRPFTSAIHTVQTFQGI